jgi:RNA polymerase sigma-70 factor (ECF subfamily)
VAPSNREITGLLAAAQRGDRQAEAELIELVYPDLRAIARHFMRRERPDHTLQPTALCHEAYIRLMQNVELDWQGRAHFFAAAAVVMRRILVDYARQRGAAKRLGEVQRVEFDDFIAFQSVPLDQLLILDEALTRLGEWDERSVRLVEMRYFGGLTDVEAAEVLGVSVRTIKRDWSAARAWLQTQFRRDPA